MSNYQNENFFRWCVFVLVMLSFLFWVFLKCGNETIATALFAGIITVSTWLYVQYRVSKQINWEAIREYYSEGDNESFVKARGRISREEGTTNGPKRDDDVSKLVNFYEKWGRLVERGYLPLWVFDGPSGDGASNLLWMLVKDIRSRRAKSLGNPRFGRSFVWLVEKIQSERYLQHWNPNELKALDKVIQELKGPLETSNNALHLTGGSTQMELNPVAELKRYVRKK